MKTTTVKLIIGIVTIMFVFASSAWADGKRGRGDGDHSSKYQQRHHKDNGHYDKHRGYAKRHHRGYDKRHHRGYDKRHHRGYAKRPMRYRHYKEHRPHHRYHAKAHRGRIEPNPLFWLFPFPPLTPFTYR